MKYDTAVMNAFGKPKMYATREMIINLKVQPNNYVIDIVMCIDATGSMQNTLNAVKNSAKTFNANLREEIGVGVDSRKVKIRVRPMFYRDWEEGRAFMMPWMITMRPMPITKRIIWNGQPVAKTALQVPTGTVCAPICKLLEFQFLVLPEWQELEKVKVIQSENPQTDEIRGQLVLFHSIADLNAWVDIKQDKDTVFIKPKTGTPPTPPIKPVNDAFNDYGDFIDLDPNLSSGNTKEDQNTELAGFLGSTNAKGGADLPEAAGACLNEAIRSNWYNIKSTDSKEYFKVPSGNVIVSEKDDVPTASYTKITNIPVVVFWSDAAINSLQKSRDYISPTTPVSYGTFENLWDGTIPNGDPDASKGVAAGGSGRPVIDSRYRMMIHFGPQNISGFSTLYDWDKVYYGGSLSTGNTQGVKVIAKKILEAIPDLLRVGS